MDLEIVMDGCDLLASASIDFKFTAQAKQGQATDNDGDMI